jgi:hypothetical protein
MIVGEWYSLDSSFVSGMEKLKFETNNFEEAMKVVFEQFGMVEHSKSRYWVLLQHKNQKSNSHQRKRLLLSIEKSNEKT